MEKKQVVIIGAGPAGLSAAIYSARAGLDTLILGCKPKVAGDYDIDNYFGFNETITGKELMEKGRSQAERFGANVSCERVLGVHLNGSGTFHVKSEHRDLEACSVVIATGVSRIRPGIDNLDDYEGKGVSYCVSCDGFFFRNKKVIVIGEGIFAANQALELTTFTPDVTIVTQGKSLTMTEAYRERLKQAGIAVLESKIVRLEGENGLERALLENGERFETYGLFVALGEASSLDFAYALGLERNGVFISVDHEQRTNIPGVFAAGDCVGGFMQIAVAVGEGAKAGRGAISHVKKTCLPPSSA